MRRCIYDGALLMIALPDFYFADGAMWNMLEYLDDRDMAVAGLQFRVIDEDFVNWLRTLPENQVLNACDLVDATFRFAHMTFKDSDITKPSNNSKRGGVFLKPIGDGLWSVIHRLPNVFLLSVTRECLAAFENAPFNAWDHVLPSSWIKRNRYKFLGSSDLFYAVELEGREGHGEPVIGESLLNDWFLPETTGVTHYVINRNFVGTLRGNNSQISQKQAPVAMDDVFSNLVL
jgi:hypothetical protein